ncbi:Mcl1_mid domain-containing protein [Meloidogyne graminicola]|uniref:Mcl1_mid domain-containing protein n=1 Tax=Meloidogyne graminicola TaxID=189291 RepID=A0A8S9ZWQ8_9BILA|nr:Mcl1_mid domain-containing protein [Meloidogyne graminicola]
MVITRSKRIHANGRLTLAVDQCGNDKNNVYCCSSDDTFGVWTCNERGSLDVDIRNTADKCHGVLAVFGEDVYLAQTTQDVITGVDQQVVVRYGLSSFLPSHALLTFSLEVTALATNGVYLIAGSGDFMVKSIRLDCLGGHLTIDRYECDAAILNISISPNGEHFAISTSDGNVHIRSTMKNSQAKKPIAKFKACNEFSISKIQCPLIYCAWDPQCKYLFIPSRGGIIVVDCLTWDRKTLLTHPDVDYENFSVLSLQSSDKNFLVASTIEGSIITWKHVSDSKFQLINIYKKIQADIGIITSIVFHPNISDLLLIAFSDGYVCSMTDCKTADARFEQFCTSLSRKDNTISNNNDDILDIEAVESDGLLAEVNANENNNKVFTLENDDKFEEMETDLGLIKSQFGFGQNDVLLSEKKLFNTNDLATMLTDREPCTTIKGMRVPKSFSVGSSPTSDDDGRFLVFYLKIYLKFCLKAWNSFGIIKSFNGNDEESSIEINFHDSNVHHEIIIENKNSKYIFGSISAHLIALASKKNSDGESVLFVNNVTCWDHDARQWIQTTDEGEQIEGLCIGGSFIAIATNLRFLRIFTPSGTQRFVFSIPGHFHTLCAQENKLAVAYATGAVLVVTDDDYEHQLAINVYNVNSLSGECAPCLEYTVPLAISLYSKLHWLQFSNYCNLISMDDECNFRIYLHSKGVWIPILLGIDLLKNPDDDFIWPISLSEFPNPYLRYFYCHNSKYPPINKSSLPTTTVPFKIPVINPKSEKGKLEAELLSIELQRFVYQENSLIRPELLKEVEKLTNNYIANLMKLFSISCKMNRENRAVEIAHRSINSKNVQGLCNYASKIQRSTLSEKVAIVGRERLQAIENEQNERRQLNHKQIPSTLIPSSSSINETSLPLIAPSKILTHKRKIPSSVFNSSTTNAANADLIEDVGRIQTITENVENTDKVFTVFESNGKDRTDFLDENESLPSDGENEKGELDTSIASSALGSALLSDSFLLDSSTTNNPFKKANKIPLNTGSIISNSRGFAEKSKDGNVAIPDFFDTLLPPKRRKN